MKSSKLKILLMIVIVGVFTVGMPIFTYAANESAVIVKQSDSEYLIYLKGYLEKEFQFAFSNDKEVAPAETEFKKSAKDTADGENNIAYATSAITEKYIWVKTDAKIENFEIDINDNITVSELEEIKNVSKIIPIKLDKKELEKEETTEETATKVVKTTKTTTVGIVKIVKDLEDGKYQLVKRNSTEIDNNLFALAELIEKNDFTDKYTAVKASKDFLRLYDEQLSNLEVEKWKDIKDATIEQPVDAKDGEQYILWLNDGNYFDVHFLTSSRIDDEKTETIKEIIKTELPYTYDNNTMLVILSIVVVAIVAVAIRIVVLKKKEMSK